MLQNFQDLNEKRIKCIKNFIIKSVEVEKEVLPIVSQCLDCMEKYADSIDEKEVRAKCTQIDCYQLLYYHGLCLTVTFTSTKISNSLP